MPRISLVLTVVLTAILYQGAAVTDAVHVVHSVFLQQFDKSDKPFPVTVVQNDGAAMFTADLLLSSQHAGQIPRHMRAEPSQTRVLTSVEFDSPVRDNDNWRVQMRASFREGVGVARFAVLVTLGGDEDVRVVEFEVTVVGVAVMVGENVVSGSFRSGVDLQRYDSWLEVRQIAFQLSVQGRSREDSLDPTGTSLSLRGGSDMDGRGEVDSVLFNGKRCKRREGVAISIESGVGEADTNTVFVLGPDKYVAGNAVLEDGCGLAFSDDGAWLIVRLEPYRVSGFRFAVEMAWERIGDVEGTTAAGTVVTNFQFDASAVPPPLVLGVTQTLDAFGGEVLSVPVSNTRSPPQTTPFQADDFTLELQLADGSREVLQAERFRYPRLAASGGQELVFRTPALNGRPEQQITTRLLYNSAEDSEPASAHQGAQLSPATPQRATGVAVPAPGSEIKLRLVSSQLAALDPCKQVTDEFDRDRFILVELGAEMYDDTTLSEHKKRQIVAELQRLVRWLPPNGARLVAVLEQAVIFTMPITNAVGTSEIDATVASLKSSVASGEFSRAINLPVDALQPRNITVVRQNECAAFPSPSLEAGATDAISGLKKRLLPLWILLGIGFATITCILVVRFVDFVLRLQKKIGTWTYDGMSTNLSDVPEPSLTASMDGKLKGGYHGDTEVAETLYSSDLSGAPRPSPPRRGRGYTQDIPSEPDIVSTLDEEELNNPVLNPEYSFRLPRYSGTGTGERDMPADLEAGRSEAAMVQMPDVEGSTDDETDGVVHRVVDRIAKVTWKRRREHGAGANSQTPGQSAREPRVPQPQIYVEQVWTSADDLV